MCACTKLYSQNMHLKKKKTQHNKPQGQFVPICFCKLLRGKLGCHCPNGLYAKSFLPRTAQSSSLCLCSGSQMEFDLEDLENSTPEDEKAIGSKRGKSWCSAMHQAQVGLACLWIGDATEKPLQGFTAKKYRRAQDISTNPTGRLLNWQTAI